MTIALEVEKIKQVLETDCRNQRLVDIENRIRDNKRRIVNMLSENIFVLRFGFKDNEQAVRRGEKDYLLLKMLNQRQRKIKIVEKLLKQAKISSEEMATYGLHSDLVGYQRIVRILQDVVVLLQEKNLLDEVRGAKDYIKVGEIEREVNWPLSLKQKYGPMEGNDYFSRKLRTQIDEYNAILHMIISDIESNEILKEEMIEFVSKMLGNEVWVKLV